MQVENSLPLSLCLFRHVENVHLNIMKTCLLNQSDALHSNKFIQKMRLIYRNKNEDTSISKMPKQLWYDMCVCVDVYVCLNIYIYIYIQNYRCLIKFISLCSYNLNTTKCVQHLNNFKCCIYTDTKQKSVAHKQQIWTVERERKKTEQKDAYQEHIRNSRCEDPTKMKKERKREKSDPNRKLSGHSVR